MGESASLFYLEVPAQRNLGLSFIFETTVDLYSQLLNPVACLSQLASRMILSVPQFHCFEG